jgi:aminoglycoside phosphotransferase (APT) family kinase protein
MARLAHGYTNDTRGDGRVVVKRYEGPDRDERRARERMVLARLQGLLPVPALLDSDGDLRMRFVAGVQGQELIDAGAAARVLRACGRTLRDIHGLDVARILRGVAREPGAVLVHGDYGPNNVLLDPATFAVTAVLDWEWARPGSAVEDLAWCEWIVRMHHGAHVPALDEFFDGYGSRPAWARRRDAMLAQCRRLLEMCERWSPGAVRLWQHRLEVTAGWLE